jgi:RNA polymerase sigma-70 factor (ECF subfamily)
VRAARRRLSNEADAEDCVQEACMSAFLHLEQLREPEQVRSWLTSIVVNASRMRARSDHVRRHVRAASIDAGEPWVLPDPSRGADDRLHARRLLREIRVRAEHHDARDLRVVEALMTEIDEAGGYAAIARACAMTTSAFKTRLSRLRKRWRRAGLARAA